MCFDQDTWTINIASDGKHFAKMILPPSLTKIQAIEDAEKVRKAFEMLESDGHFEVTLTRWVLRGDDIEF